MRFILGLLIGAGLGVCVGLLVATKPGSEMRQVLHDRMTAATDDLDEEP